jgi:hypothetical protein
MRPLVRPKLLAIDPAILLLQVVLLLLLLPPAATWLQLQAEKRQIQYFQKQLTPAEARLRPL